MVATYYTWFILFYITFGSSICVEAQSTSLANTGVEAGAETEDFIDGKLELLLQKIVSQLQARITEKIKTTTHSEFDHVKEITYNMLLKHTTNITEQIKNEIDSAFKETKIFESSEITNQKLDAIDKKIESDKNEEIKELVNKINLLTTNNDHLNKKINILSTNIQQLNNKIDLVCNETSISELIGITNEKLGILENTTTHEEHYIKNVLKTSEQIISKETNMLKSIEDINKKVEKIENMPKLQQNIETLLNSSETILTSTVGRNNQTEEILKNMILSHDSENGKIVSFCDVAVPGSVQTRSDIWREYLSPAEDALDRHMVQKTGCAYKAFKHGESFYLRAATFDGTLFEWRAAVRAIAYVSIYVYIGLSSCYHFVIGQNANKQTRVYEYSTRKEWFSSTPDILSPDRYEAFYIRIRPGTLTFGRECDRAPLFTRDVTVSRGEEVKVEYYAFSYKGGKFLYACPANVAGRAGA